MEIVYYALKDVNQSHKIWNIINKIIHIAVVQELTRDDHENFKKKLI